MARNSNNRFSGWAAGLGGSAVVAMGVLAVTLGAAPQGAGALIPTGKMNVGETTTVTYSGTVAPVVAVPPVKAKPFGG